MEPPNEMNDIHLIALCSVPDVGPVTVRRLLSAFGTPEAVFGASVGELSSVEGVSRARAQAVKDYSGFGALQRSIERLKGEGIRVAGLGSPDYPEPLRCLDDAPPVVYIRGGVADDDKYAIAVVGSRRPTNYGSAVAETLSGELAGMGFTVVSGLARGIDTAAHRAAVGAGGRSIAVMGSGIDVPYPPENKGLMKKISDSGYVISEFPPGAPPGKENFPRRNRLISGLSLGVVVVEAAEGSGALITARYALEQGKEVFAVPGNINSAASTGANELIRQGAKLVVRASDIVEELAAVLKGFIKSKETQRPAVTGEEKTLCDAMGMEPRHIDDISRDCGLPSHTALSILLSLELKGVVRQTGGMRFRLA